MGLISLDFFNRSTTGKNANRRARAAGRIPAVIYGTHRETANIELDQKGFVKILKGITGSGAIFQIHQDGEIGEDDPIALLKEVQSNPVNDEILHVDLMEIPRGVPVTVAVSLVVVGSNNAVKTGEGSVAQSLTEVELSCRPSQLPDFIEVDITDLELNDKIFVRDLKTEVGEFVTDPETLVLNIKPPVILVEEEPEEGEEGVEGEEGAEGESAEGDSGDSTEKSGE